MTGSEYNPHNVNSIYSCSGQDTIGVVGKGASLINAKVNNKEFEALVDSGAAISLVSREFADSVGIVWITKTPEIPYYSAGRNTLEMLGEAMVDVKLGRTTVTEKFLVSKQLSQRMIIGGDFLRKHNMDIVFSRNMFRIKGQDIPMVGPRKSSKVESIEPEVFRPSEKARIDIDRLKPTEVERLKTIMDKHSDAFSKNDEDIGESDFVHEIELTNYRPIKQRAYRVPNSQQSIIETEVAKMLRMGVIRRTTSDWSSPVVLVSKPDKAIRFCTY